MASTEKSVLFADGSSPEKQGESPKPALGGGHARKPKTKERKKPEKLIQGEDNKEEEEDDIKITAIT